MQLGEEEEGTVVKGMGWGHGQLERGKRGWRAGRESQEPLQRGGAGVWYMCKLHQILVCFRISFMYLSHKIYEPYKQDIYAFL